MYKYKMIMKKILLGLVMLLTTATMNAQIELEHVFDGSISVHEDMELDRQMWLKNTTYAIYNTTNGGQVDIDIYNADFSYRTTLKDLHGFDGLLCVAENIFTNDKAICYVEVDSANKISIIREDGTVIATIFTENDISYFFLRKVGDQYKFIIVDNNCVYNPETYESVCTYKTYIYSCPGNGETATNVQNVSAKVKRNAYPNPANELVTLPYEANGATSMKIYDMQGKLVERKFLDKNKQELQLNVKDYPSGMYFFDVNGESNSFVVE